MKTTTTTTTTTTPWYIRAEQTRILIDTCNTYNAKNRAICNTGTCVYSHSVNGIGCAVGRLLTAEQADALDALAKSTSTIGGLSAVGSLIAHLPEHIQSLGLKFLEDIQDLHDNNDFWNEQGLSEDGKLHRDNIILYHNLYII